MDILWPSSPPTWQRLQGKGRRPCLFFLFLRENMVSKVPGLVSSFLEWCRKKLLLLLSPENLITQRLPIKYDHIISIICNLPPGGWGILSQTNSWQLWGTGTFAKKWEGESRPAHLTTFQWRLLIYRRRRRRLSDPNWKPPPPSMRWPLSLFLIVLSLSFFGPARSFSLENLTGNPD